MTLIVALAVGLRVGWIGVASYAWDEARISYDALSMARGGVFALAGQGSSVGIPFFPASVWVFTPPYAISADPLIASWYVVLLNVIAAVGIWAIARRWNAWAGFIAGLFFAANPYAVFYGRSIWQPNLLAPLAVAWIAAALYAVTQTGRKRTSGVALTVFIGGIAPQIHFAGAALTLAAIYCIIRFRWYRRPLPLLIGAGIAAVAALPYLYYIGVIAPGVLDRVGGVTSAPSTVDLSALENVIRLGVGWDWAYLGGGDGDSISRFLPTVIASALVLIVGAAAGVRMIVQRGKVAETRRSAVIIELALVLVGVSPLLFARHSTPVLPHYQLIALPALALIAGAAATLIHHRVWRIGITACMIALAIGWSVQVAITLNQASRVRPVNSALSSILRESRDAAYGMPADRPVLFFTHGDNPLIDGEVTVFETLWWTRPHRILNGDVLLILPPYPATIMTTLAPFQAWEELQVAGLATDVQTFPRRDGALPFMSAQYDGVSDPAGFTLLDDAIQFADGTQIEGWRVRTVGDRFRVSTLWRVTDMPPREVLQAFHHLYRTGDDVDGGLFMGSDVPLSIHTWRRDDRVIVMADFFDVPPNDTYTLALGHYRLSDGTRMMRSDEGGDRVLIPGVTK